ADQWNTYPCARTIADNEARIATPPTTVCREFHFGSIATPAPPSMLLPAHSLPQDRCGAGIGGGAEVPGFPGAASIRGRMGGERNRRLRQQGDEWLNIGGVHLAVVIEVRQRCAFAPRFQENLHEDRGVGRIDTPVAVEVARHVAG